MITMVRCGFEVEEFPLALPASLVNIFLRFFLPLPFLPSLPGLFAIKKTKRILMMVMMMGFFFLFLLPTGAWEYCYLWLFFYVWVGICEIF